MSSRNEKLSCLFPDAAAVLSFKMFFFPILLLASTIVGGQPRAEFATLHGVVRNADGHPLPSVAVNLQREGAPAITVSTDSTGTYRCGDLAPGIYHLRAEKSGEGSADFASVHLREGEVKQIDLVLNKADAGSSSSSSGQPEFFDQPQFTVAGVTNTMNYGGHGSEAVSRNSQVLAKDVTGLGRTETASSGPGHASPELKSLREALEREHKLKPDDYANAYQLARVYTQLGEFDRANAIAQSALARQETAEIHHLLGDIEEKRENPLQAVREYQRAAELEPSETNLFAWGAELLAHGALEPAIDVFTRGNRSFPRSPRMLIGLGVAWYGNRSADLAAKYLCEASDIGPEDSAPYLVLGKMQIADVSQAPAILARLERFVQTQPQNPLANYYYAVALKKSLQGAPTNDGLLRVESHLKKATTLDPQLAPAFLQLGMISEERGDWTQSIAAYQQSIEADPQSGDAHYRLAQVYRRRGDTTKAEQEIRVYKELSSKSAEEQQREAREIQQFVYTLRDSKSPAPR